MRVELDIFSGRPNPVWELGPVTARELLELESMLGPALEPVSEPPGLGYRGFRYGETGQVRRAYRGVVQLGSRSFQDPPRSIENLLLGTLPGEFASLRESVRQQIAR